MASVDLSLGTVHYEDTGAPDGPVVVLIHGLIQDGTVWNDVVRELEGEHRVIVPTLPLGAHPVAMKPDADVSPRSVARLIGEFADALELPEDTVFVENDAGRIQQLAAERPDRVGRMVIAGCEAFENYPPGAPGRLLVALSNIPGAIYALALAWAPRPVRRIPGTGFAVMTERGLSDELTDGWFTPFRVDKAVRRDLVKYLQAARPTEMTEAAEKLGTYDRPALILWGKQDRMMPPEHGRRFAELLPNAELVEFDDCRTLIPIDQPLAMAAELKRFIAATA